MKFLINKDNIPIEFFDDDHRFSEREKLMNIVSYDVDETQVHDIMRYCYWNGTTFIIKDSNEPFDNIKESAKKIKKSTIEKSVIDKTQEEFLQATHRNETSPSRLEVIRREYIKRTLPLLRYVGFDKVLAALKYGCYTDIRNAFSDLPHNSKTEFIKSDAYPESDKDMFVNSWKIFDKQLVEDRP